MMHIYQGLCFAESAKMWRDVTFLTVFRPHDLERDKFIFGYFIQLPSIWSNVIAHPRFDGNYGCNPGPGSDSLIQLPRLEVPV